MQFAKDGLFAHDWHVCNIGFTDTSASRMVLVDWQTLCAWSALGHNATAPLEPDVLGDGPARSSMSSVIHDERCPFISRTDDLKELRGTKERRLQGLLH